MRKNSAIEILARISMATGLKGSDLAKELKTSNSTVSSWKARDSIPFTKCEEIAAKYSLSLDWLMWGEGAMHHDALAPAALTPEEQALLTLFKELSEKDQREICQDAAQKKRFAELERQVEKMVLQLERLNPAG